MEVTAPEKCPTYIYQIPGLYSVTETVTGPGGSNTLVMSGEINRTRYHTSSC